MQIFATVSRARTMNAEARTVHPKLTPRARSWFNMIGKITPPKAEPERSFNEGFAQMNNREKANLQIVVREQDAGAYASDATARR
jgi:hypothetical protein